MEILKQLLEKFDTENLNRLANFIGDPVEQVEKATELSIGSLLNGLIHESKTNEGVEKVLKVIKDGGHSGDILDDLPGLLTNPDKTQLLITIGTNINSHFFGDSISSISDKISQFSGVKKTSSSSLISFAAPLVLGFLGKQVKAQRLNPNSFGHFMREQENNVKGVLPPSLATMFSSANKVEAKTVAAESTEVSTTIKKETKATSSEGNSLGILAWILLGALILAAAFYAFKDKIDGFAADSSNDIELVDSLNATPMVDSIDIAAERVTTSNDVNESSDLIGQSTTDKKVERTQSTRSEVQNSNPPSSSRSNQVSNPEASSFRSYAPVVNQLGQSGSWAHFGAGEFKRNSAELRNQNEVEKLADYLLQNPNRTLRISGLGQKRVIEDRAYAIREALYLKGVPLNKMIIENGPKGDGGSVRLSLN